MTEYLCRFCGYEGKAKKHLRGSGKLEWIIWLTLLFPGPLYSIWRRVGVPRNCPHCKKEGMVKLNSDEGWVVKQKLEQELGIFTPSPSAKMNSESFGHDVKQFEEVVKKKPVNPDQW
jgi:hypothetical protein